MEEKGRLGTVLDKGSKLQTLCGVDVCVVCFDPVSGQFFTWPKEIADTFHYYSDLVYSGNSDGLGFHQPELGMMGFGINIEPPDEMTDQLLEEKKKQKDIGVKVEEQQSQATHIDFGFDLNSDFAEDFLNELPQLDRPYFTPTCCL